jgi:protein-L-isoaspartate(D-aspartate) O-methyltransferase
MTAMNLELARFNMIMQQIRPWDVLDQQVLDLIADLPRDHFVDEAYRHLAYADVQLPIGHGERMMEPKLEARLLQELQIKPDDRALEIGTGSGYLTACLGRLCAHVESVEIHQDLHQLAAQRLAGANINNLTLYCADAARGWDGHFDVIVVTGSLPDYDPCFEQLLNSGGRLFIVTGEAPAMEAMRITRWDKDLFDRQILFETSLKPLVGREKKPEFVW